MRTLIVDDEALARANLRVLLESDPEIGLVGECSSGAAALIEIRHNPPDILFLDVQMPECDGLDVLERLGGDVPRAVILVTAYDHYALRAFEAGALDYILKPFNNARFYQALDRAKEKVARYHAEPINIERLAVKSLGLVSFIKVAHIDWIEAADYYACLHVGGKTHILRRSMSDLERDLPPARFCRIHRSTIVNIYCVRGIQLDKNGDSEVLMEDGTELRLSRGYREAFRKACIRVSRSSSLL